MRISDWSSDVCSSDLAPIAQGRSNVRIVGGSATSISTAPWQIALLYAGTPNSYDAQFCGGTIRDQYTIITAAHCVDGYRSEERRAGQECVSTFRTRWALYH